MSCTVLISNDNVSTLLDCQPAAKLLGLVGVEQLPLPLNITTHGHVTSPLVWLLYWQISTLASYLLELLQIPSLVSRPRELSNDTSRDVSTWPILACFCADLLRLGPKRFAYITSSNSEDTVSEALGRPLGEVSRHAQKPTPVCSAS